MKAKHRHELATHELLQFLRSASTRLRKLLDEHFWLVIGPVAVVLLAGAWWIREMRSRSAADAAGWAKLAEVRLFEPERQDEEFEDLSERAKGTAVAAWAKLAAAESHLELGLRRIVENRAVAVEDHLQLAEDHFQQLQKDNSVPAVVKARALIGKAQCLEAMCEGEPTEAIRAYRMLLDDPSLEAAGLRGVVETWARQRIEALESDEAQSFYAWFKTHKPPPRPEPKPKDTGMPEPSDVKPSIDFEKFLKDLEDEPARTPEADKTPLVPLTPK